MPDTTRQTDAQGRLVAEAADCRPARSLGILALGALGASLVLLVACDIDCVGGQRRRRLMAASTN
jgi:hypothetical protein